MSQSQEQPKINPAWKPLLDKLPPEFHNQILPDLMSWEKGVQQRFTDIHAEYEEYKPFKQFIDQNIAPDYAMQAVVLADQMQREPAKVMAQVNEAWELGFISKEEAAKLAVPAAGEGTDGDDENFLSDDADILKNPQVKAMYDTLQNIQNKFETEERTQAEKQQITEFESELDALEAKAKEDKLPFHRMFVTALIAQGIDGDEAVKQYHQVLAGTAANPETVVTDESGSDDTGDLVVMGNGGSVGSGTADGSVDYAKLSTSDFNDTIEQLLAKANENSQG